MSKVLLNVPIPSIEQATENAKRWLQQGLAQAVQKANPADLSAVDLELARGNIQVLSFVVGTGIHGIYRYVRDFVARQAIPSRSSGEFLDGWLETYGMRRKGAESAGGVVSGTGVNGMLEAGTLMQIGSVQFRVLADVAPVAGVVTAYVMAVKTGIEGNQAAGTVLTLVSPIDGIDSSFTVGAAGLTGGLAEETDDEAIYRLVQRLSNEPMGGSPADYARWALSVGGITRAWGQRNPVGPTSAGVIIMSDNNEPYGQPTTAQQQAVYDYISDPLRGPPDELFVIIPTLQVIDFNLRLVPDTAKNREDAKKALRDLFFRESVPGGALPHNHVVEVISGVVGEYNHQILSPAMTLGGEFEAANYADLLVLGEVTFTP